MEIARGKRDRAFLIGLPQLDRLLASVTFHPEVLAEEGSVSVWLPELELWGRGDTFAEAKADLVAEVRDYVAEYLDDTELYLAAPNRARHFPAILRALTLDRSGRLAEALFAAPVDAEAMRQPVPA